MRCTNPKCTKFETRTPKPFFKELKKTSCGHAGYEPKVSFSVLGRPPVVAG